MPEVPEADDSRYVCSISDQEWAALREEVRRVAVKARYIAGLATAGVLICVLLGAVVMEPHPPAAVLALVALAASGLMFYGVYSVYRRVEFDASTADLEQQVAAVLNFDLTSDDLVRLIVRGGTIAGQFKLTARDGEGSTDLWAQDLDTPAYRRSRMWFGDALN